jgi:hypothetical protein
VHVEQSADGRGLDLVFRNITSDDAGLYACTAAIDDVPAREEFELEVLGWCRSYLVMHTIYYGLGLKNGYALLITLVFNCSSHGTGMLKFLTL